MKPKGGDFGTVLKNFVSKWQHKFLELRKLYSEILEKKFCQMTPL